MIKLSNYARPMEKKGKYQYYRWKVFVDAEREVLDSIERVSYELHPTFPNPRRTSTSAVDRFSLETEGWGEFSILAVVEFKDGRAETLTYRLDLAKGWPEET